MSIRLYIHTDEVDVFMRKEKRQILKYSKFYLFFFDLFFIKDNIITSNISTIMAREDEYDYLFKGKFYLNKQKTNDT